MFVLESTEAGSQVGICVGMRGKCLVGQHL